MLITRETLVFPLRFKWLVLFVLISIFGFLAQVCRRKLFIVRLVTAFERVLARYF